MKQCIHQFVAITALLSVLGVTAANAADSTSIRRPQVTPVVQPYLLDTNKISTDTGNYSVNRLATKQRCSPSTHPILMTSISSINVYGSAQAIEGVYNTITLNPANYMIAGSVSAPVNVAARDNGVTLNYQIWCQPNKTA